VAFVNAFVGAVGYQFVVGLPANLSTAVTALMIVVSLGNVLDFLILLWGWQSQAWAVDVVPYADIWHVQQDQATAQYLGYYSYTWMDWHELEQRIFFFLSVRCMILGF
jgi:hypothetical protein